MHQPFLFKCLVLALLLATIGPASVCAQTQDTTQAHQPTAAEKAAAEAQTKAEKEKNDAIFRFFSAQFAIHSGYARANYGPVNELFRQAGYPTVPAGYLSSALSYFVRIQKISFGLEGQFYDDHQTENNRTTAVNSSSAMFRVGYCIFNSQFNQCVTPSLGFAFTDTDFTLTDSQTASGTNAAALLNGAQYSKTLHYQNKNLALGINYNYFPSDDTRHRAVIGARLDYLVRLGDGSYSTIDRKQTVPGPAIDPLRFRICTELGFLF